MTSLRRPRYVLLAMVSAILALETALAQSTDTDADGISDAADNCDVWPNPDQADLDDNGIGNACECGDQDGSGRVDVRDLVAINLAIFDPAQAGALCDTNNDGACDVADIIGANLKIFGSAAHCSRYPPDPSLLDQDGDGFTPAQGDCNDSNASIAPERPPISPDALEPVVEGPCEEGPQTPDDCNPGICFNARGPFRDFRETDGCSNPAALDPNNPSGAATCSAAAFATGDADDPRGCDLHDFCYRTCGSSQSRCDQQFLDNLRAICESLPASQSHCIAPCREWAETYFTAVANAPAAQEAWTRNQGLYCSCCGGGGCGDGVCDPEAGERPSSCAQDCPRAEVGAECVTDPDCEVGSLCSFTGRCIRCGDGRCDEGEFCGTAPGCKADCGACEDDRPCRVDADCQSSFCDQALGFCKPCQGNGVGCLRDSACCSDICNNTFQCASCKDPGQGCLTDDVCCSDICNNAFQCATCKDNGQACLTDDVCCSDICNNAFQCASCKSNGQSCLTNGVCCSKVCNSAFQCASCRSNGEGCTSSSVCCSGLCNSFSVCAACRIIGGSCGADRDCCSGNCGALGVCAP